jgi:addiction module HigA family antidote
VWKTGIECRLREKGAPNARKSVEVENMRLTTRKPASGWNLQRISTHPGEMLLEELLVPLGITQNALALKIRVPATRIGDIVHGKRSITPNTALRLARFFGNSPEFWLNLQQMHDLSKARLELRKTIERDVEAYAGGISIGPTPCFTRNLGEVPCFAGRIRSGHATRPCHDHCRVSTESAGNSTSRALEPALVPSTNWICLSSPLLVSTTTVLPSGLLNPT